MDPGVDVRSAQSRESAPHPSRLTAIVLNYQTPAEARRAVASVLASDRPADEVIVVDNAAPEDGAAQFGSFESAITYVPTASNLGFSGGMNVGIRLALAHGADRVLLVNSDAVVPPDCIDGLERALAGIPQIGIAGPVVRSQSDPSLILSLGLEYAPRSGRMRDRAARRSRSALDDRTAIDQVAAVSGCVMLVRRAVFEAIGLLDEDYFFSFEDIDFGLRAARQGFASVIVRSAVAYHDGSRSIGQRSPRRLYFAARNHLLLAARASPAPSRVAGWGRFAAIVALNAAHAATAPGGAVGERLGAVWAGTRDHLAGRYGDGPAG